MRKARYFQHIRLSVIILAAVVLSCTVFVGTAGADTYSSTKSLEAHKKLGVDYRILQTFTPSKNIVISIHGGSIERGTNQIAQAVAVRSQCDYYGFIGLKPGLHVTSSHFNDPAGVSMVKASNQTLSIHGCTGNSRITYLGGLDRAFMARVKTELVKAGFIVKKAPDGLGGRDTANICNRNSRGQGVQLELTMALRNYLMNNKTAFDRYVSALARAET